MSFLNRLYLEYLSEKVLEGRKSSGDKIIGSDGVTAWTGAGAGYGTQSSATTGGSSHRLWLKSWTIPACAEGRLDPTTTAGKVVLINNIVSKILDLECVAIGAGALVRASNSRAGVVAILNRKWDAFSIGTLARWWRDSITWVQVVAQDSSLYNWVIQDVLKSSRASDKPANTLKQVILRGCKSSRDDAQKSQRQVALHFGCLVFTG